MKAADPPCSECLPELFLENVDAMRIWNLVLDQRIWVSGGMGTPQSVGLMHGPIWKLIDEFEVDDRLKTFQKVLRIYEEISRLEKEKQG